MVFNNHDVANLEIGIHTSGCIGNEQRVYAQLIHYAYGECHGSHSISFIEMETSLHGKYIDIAELSKNELSRMSLYRGEWEVGDFFVCKLIGISYF